MTAEAVRARMTALFRDVLDQPELAADGDFFDHGDSLLAARLIMRVRVEFGQEVPLAWIFEGRTAAALADRLTGADTELPRAAAPPPIPRADGQRPLRLSHAQERLWFLNQLDPDDPAYNEPLVYRVRGPLDTAALRTALRRVVDRHEALRTTFVLDGDAPVLRVLEDVDPGLDTRDLCEEYAEGGDAWLRGFLRAEIRRPFDLTAAPSCAPTPSDSARTRGPCSSRSITSPPTAGRTPSSSTRSAAATGRPPDPAAHPCPNPCPSASPTSPSGNATR
ncbi:hypothetical protein GCM10020254_08470 [Streptomyces goshikiensis]